MGQSYGTCNSDVTLNGKTVLVTGANTGIGKATAKNLYERGARVLLACRNMVKANEAIEDIKIQCQHSTNVGELKAIHLDLSSLKSVKECAEVILKTEDHLNILVNNACVIGVPYTKTEDGYELTFQTNHLGHFLFTLLLMPLLMKSTPARIVNVSSVSHAMLWGEFNLNDVNFTNRKYSFIRAYGESKLMNILFTKELVRKFEENNIKGINVYAAHPGAVSTEAGRYFDETVFPGVYWMWRNLFKVFAKNPDQGAATSIYCAVDEKCATETGLYYAECKVTAPAQNASDEKLAKDLWALSLGYVGLKEDFNPFVGTNIS
ncbi:retinol dehydrogenase 13-like [Diabrotica undecimpunctata]|uniref:retinol dehydrogenase 13-like n=1 Tax=Diabrotica undecimpunctata TaxID=50387 RepID=UPI003B63FA4F